MAKCTAKRSDGSECQANAMTGSDLCFWHNPDAAEDRLDASSRGGSKRSFELPVGAELTPGRARRILSGVVAATASGAMDAATARTIGYLLSIESKIREGADLENRIAALERARELIGA